MSHDLLVQMAYCILENKNLLQIKAKQVRSVQSGPNDNDIGLIISSVSTKSRSNFSLAGF